MMGKCPGRTAPRNLDSILATCPSCGRMVEFFTDEPTRHCRCGRLLLRESLPRCAEWCPAAEVCLGEAMDMRELQRRLAGLRDDLRARQCLESIRERLEAAEKQDGKGSPGAETGGSRT